IWRYVKRAKCLRIDLASDLQPVANLVTPNRGRSFGALFTSSVAVVKALVCEGLLHRLGRLIGAHRAYNAESDGKVRSCSFHGWRFYAAARYFGFARASASACVMSDPISRRF